MAYLQNQQLLDRAEARIKQLFDLPPCMVSDAPARKPEPGVEID